MDWSTWTHLRPHLGIDFDPENNHQDLILLEHFAQCYGCIQRTEHDDGRITLEWVAGPEYHYEHPGAEWVPGSEYGWLCGRPEGECEAGFDNEPDALDWVFNQGPDGDYNGAADALEALGLG